MNQSFCFLTVRLLLSGLVASSVFVGRPAGAMGSIKAGNATTDTSWVGGTAGVGALTLAAASGVPSPVDFSGSTANLGFADFARMTDRSILNITEWNGSSANNGSEQALLTASAFVVQSTFSQSGMRFDGSSGYGIVDSGFFEAISPVPEPSTWAAALLTTGVIGWSQRRRVRGVFAALRRRN